MLIKDNVRLQRIIGGIWESAFTIFLVCLLSAILNEFVLKKFIELPIIIPSLLGTTLALFIGFNNNQAYARWWEARTIMGAMSSECRSLARQCISYIGQRQESEKMVYRQIAFAYALKEFLRNTNENLYEKYLKEDIPVLLKRGKSKHNLILLLQAEHLERIYSNESIDGFKFTQINQTLNAISSQMGKAERIKNTVFPTTYAYYTKLFIWIFIISVTIVLNNSMGIVAFMFGSIIGYVYYVSHYIGQTLLNPFEAKPIGIPLDQITRNIEINLKEMLGEKELPEPTASINNEYIL